MKMMSEQMNMSGDQMKGKERRVDLSGLELLEGVRAITPEAAVMIMTAYGTIETAVSAIKAGAADYLTKPVNLDVCPA